MRTNQLTHRGVTLGLLACLWCANGCTQLRRGTEASTSGRMAAYIRANYTKREHMVLMRDGVRLFTAVYAPKDTSRKWPMMMIRI